MRFVNQTIYDRAALTEYFRVRRRLMRGKTPLFSWLAVAALALAELLVIAMALMAGEPGQLLRSATFMLILLIMIFAIVKEDLVQAMITLKKLDPGMKVNEAVFTDDMFVVSTEISEMECEYDRIQYAFETDHYFFFFISKEKGKICDKRGFEEGDPETFRTFIEEKLGEPLEYI